MGREGKKGWRYWLLRLVRLLVIGYCTVMLFACSMANRMIFMPPAASYAESDEGVVRFGVDSQYAGIYLPAPEESAPTILWAHGNAEDAGQAQDIGRELQARGIGVLLYDYPGYGLSAGKASEEGSFRAAEAAFRFLTEEKKRKDESIVLLGQSVGGGPTVHLAADGKGAGLVLISPFKSAFRVVTGVKILPFDRFDNWKRIEDVEVPLLVIHGDADEVVPFSHGEALFQKYEGRKEFLRLKGVGHNDLWLRSGDEVLDKVARFTRAQVY